MKAKYILSGLLMVALVIGGTGYGVAAKAEGKVTGGGTFTHAAWPSDYANFGDKISFGFNGQRLNNGEAKGQFQLVNHDKGIKIHGTFSSYEVNGARVKLDGQCSINGADVPFHVETSTLASWETIWIWIGTNPPYNPSAAHFWGQIYKGNITKHNK